MDKERLKKAAKKFNIEIEFDTETPGVYDQNYGEFYSFEELLGDILPTELTFNKNRLNQNNKILAETYKMKAKNNDVPQYSLNEKYKTEKKEYMGLTSVYKWVA